MLYGASLRIGVGPMVMAETAIVYCWLIGSQLVVIGTIARESICSDQVAHVSVGG